VCVVKCLGAKIAKQQPIGANPGRMTCSECQVNRGQVPSASQKLGFLFWYGFIVYIDFPFVRMI
jgi:hypothetical protein